MTYEISFQFCFASFIYLCKQKHQRRGNHVHKLKIAMQVRKKEPVAHEMDNKGRRTNKTNI